MRVSTGFVLLSLPFIVAAKQVHAEARPGLNIDGTCNPIFSVTEADYCLEQSEQDLHKLATDVVLYVRRLENPARNIRATYRSLLGQPSNISGLIYPELRCTPSTVGLFNQARRQDEKFLDFRLGAQLSCANSMLVTMQVIADKFGGKEADDLFKRTQVMFDDLMKIKDNMVRAGYMNDGAILKRLAKERDEFLQDEMYASLRAPYVGKLYGQSALNAG